MKKLAVLSVAFLLIGAWAPQAKASGEAYMSLSPTSVSAATDETFSLTVMVYPNGESVDTVRAELSFDASLLEILSVDHGSLFPNESPANDIDNTSGTLTYGGYKFGTPVTSSGTFITVTFHALSAGTVAVTLEDETRLIYEGEEVGDTTALNSSTISISGDTVEALDGEEEEEEAAEEEEDTSSQSAEQRALVYFGAFAGRMPSSGVDWEALHCIAYDTCNPDASERMVDREATSLEVFGAKYARLPSSTMDWYTIHALAYTEVFYDWDGDGLTGADETEEEESSDEATEEEVVVEEEVAEEEEEESEASLEEQALVYFGAFAGYLPSSSVDWEALHCIAYDDCYPADAADRNVEHEAQSLVIFGEKYASMPSSTMDWNTLHAIAYTEVFYDWSEIDAAEEEAVVEEEEEEEEVVDEEATEEDDDSISQDEAIGLFGQITGYLPSSSADWLAVQYMVEGYTPSADDRDVEAESSAIARFGEVFGELPSSSADWNVVAAIAYSGAIL